MELVLDLKKRYTYADYLTWMDNVRTTQNMMQAFYMSGKALYPFKSLTDI